VSLGQHWLQEKDRQFTSYIHFTTKHKRNHERRDMLTRQGRRELGGGPGQKHFLGALLQKNFPEKNFSGNNFFLGKKIFRAIISF
jgi:hypothetical protein